MTMSFRCGRRAVRVARSHRDDLGLSQNLADQRRAVVFTESAPDPGSKSAITRQLPDPRAREREAIRPSPSPQREKVRRRGRERGRGADARSCTGFDVCNPASMTHVSSLGGGGARFRRRGCLLRWLPASRPRLSGWAFSRPESAGCHPGHGGCCDEG